MIGIACSACVAAFLQLPAAPLQRCLHRILVSAGGRVESETHGYAIGENRLVGGQGLLHDNPMWRELVVLRVAKEALHLFDFIA